MLLSSLPVFSIYMPAFFCSWVAWLDIFLIFLDFLSFSTFFWVNFFDFFFGGDFLLNQGFWPYHMKVFYKHTLSSGDRCFTDKSHTNPIRGERGAKGKWCRDWLPVGKQDENKWGTHATTKGDTWTNMSSQAQFAMVGKQEGRQHSLNACRNAFGKSALGLWKSRVVFLTTFILYSDPCLK